MHILHIRVLLLLVIEQCGWRGCFYIGNMAVYGGNAQQFNGPMMADVGYRAGLFGYPPHAGGYPQPGDPPPPPDARDGSHYSMTATNQFPPVDGSGGGGGAGGHGQPFPDLRQMVPGSFQYQHPASLPTGAPQNNVSNSSSTSPKPPISVPPSELPELGNQSKSKQEDHRGLPPKSSAPDVRLPQSTEASGTSSLPSAVSNGSAEQLPKKASSSDVEQPQGEVTITSSGSVETNARTSAPPAVPAFPSNASHQAPNMDAVHGRSSDVVAMEGMPSRYGVQGPEDMMDPRYPVNGRDGYIGRMGHPVAVDGTFRHGYQRQMESYDRGLYGTPAGMPPHFQHPGYFNHPNQPGYQYHQHTHSSHGPPYHSQVVDAEVLPILFV